MVPTRPPTGGLIGAVIPPQGWHPRDDATYFPVPWLLSTAGYGVLLGNDETSYFRLGNSDPSAWSVEAQATNLSLRFVAGPAPADALSRLTEITGRQPAPAAPWVFGPWYQPTGNDQLGQARALRAADVPGSAVNTYLHYLPCGAQQGVESQQPPYTAAFHDLGYAITAYFNPMICTSYQPAYSQAVAAGVLNTNQANQPYVYNLNTGNLFSPVSQFDFTAPGTQSFWDRLLSEAVGHGYDGWMEDFGEYTPLDAKSADGTPGTRMHNLYPTRYHCATFNYTRGSPHPVAPFVRSGWTGTQRCAQIVWGGDPTTDWGYDGLDSAIKQALSLGTSGISRWGSDIGGYFSVFAGKLTPELLDRWIELGAVSGVMRTEANGFKLASYARPQVTDPEILPIWRRYAKLRTQLYPYLVAADANYRRTGMPTMRDLGLVYPADPTASGKEDEFMFGPDLLASPVHQPGQTERNLYLPGGRWIDFWRALAYRPADGALRLRRAPILKGGAQHQRARAARPASVDGPGRGGPAAAPARGADLERLRLRSDRRAGRSGEPATPDRIPARQVAVSVRRERRPALEGAQPFLEAHDQAGEATSDRARCLTHVPAAQAHPLPGPRRWTPGSAKGLVCQEGCAARALPLTGKGHASGRHRPRRLQAALAPGLEREAAGYRSTVRRGAMRKGLLMLTAAALGLPAGERRGEEAPQAQAVRDRRRSAQHDLQRRLRRAAAAGAALHR